MIALDPVWGETAQARIYRLLLAAFSAPGEVQHLDAACGGVPAALAVLATLADHAVCLADPTGLLSEADRGLLGAPSAPAHEADLVLMPGHEPPPSGFACRLGGPLTPERGATLLVVVPVLTGAGDGPACSGPGTRSGARLDVAGLHPAWLLWRAGLRRHLPDGIDLILTAGRDLLALPRSTRLAGES